MLFRDPFFHLYVLHVAALFLIALWPRLSGQRRPGANCQSGLLALEEPITAVAAEPRMVRPWELKPFRADAAARFAELEATCAKECADKFAQAVDRIRLV
jgi:hypothetical protein